MYECTNVNECMNDGIFMNESMHHRIQANTSEKLRQVGLSQQYPHPVNVTQVRSCTLEPPPPPENIPGETVAKAFSGQRFPSH